MSSSRRKQRPDGHRPRRRPPSPSFWRGPWPIVGALGGIVVLVAVFILISRAQQPPPQPSADPVVIAKLTSVSAAVTDSVGTGGMPNPFTATSTATVLTGPNGKPEFLYIGAEWCPYCAAERWAIVVALSRFGQFQHLGFTTSSSSDVYPNTRTLSFDGSTWGSAYLDFVGVELEDRNRNQLQTPSPQENQIWQSYDPNGSIPFLDVANRYTTIGQGVPASVLQGLSWQQIADALSDPASPVTKAIVGNANWLTAAICKISGSNAAPICAEATIKQIESQLP